MPRLRQPPQDRQAKSPLRGGDIVHKGTSPVTLPVPAPVIEADAMLSRAQAAAALQAAGFPVTLLALQTRASRGNGPKYRRWGKSCVYRWGDCLEWAQTQGAEGTTASEISNILAAG